MLEKDFAIYTDVQLVEMIGSLWLSIERGENLAWLESRTTGRDHLDVRFEYGLPEMHGQYVAMKNYLEERSKNNDST